MRELLSNLSYMSSPLTRHLRETSRISQGSTQVLDHILCAEDCDVDVQNSNALDRDTPLHLAVKFEEDGRSGLRSWLGEWRV